MDVKGGFDCLELRKSICGLNAFPCVDGSVTLCQRRYIDDILKRFGMEDSLAVASPISWKASKWVHRLLREISTATGASSPELVVFEDNQSCIKVTKNPSSTTVAPSTSASSTTTPAMKSSVVRSKSSTAALGRW